MNVYVFGLGHIGLPLACWVAMSGEKVYGVDINLSVLDSIKNGNINIEEYYNGIHISRLAKSLINTDELQISNKFCRVDQSKSVFIISVGLIDGANGNKDITPITSVINQIKPYLIPGDLVVLRSTVIPGTCENVVMPLLEETGMHLYFAYCPETIIETNAFEEFKANEMIIGGANDDSLDAAKKFFGSLSKSNIICSKNIRTVEMAKIVQNIHRDVNIALANEISDAASVLDVDFYELQKLVNTNPRVDLLSAGLGVGGYCLPNALGYLKAALTGNKFYRLELCEKGRKLNEDRPKKVLNLISKALNDAGKSLKGSTVAVTGLAMKDFCADCRFSPAIDLINLLVKEGAIVNAYDPLVPYLYPYQTNSFKECLQNADCLVIEAKQRELEYPHELLSQLMNKPTLVVDTRNVMQDAPNIKLYKL